MIEFVDWCRDPSWESLVFLGVAAVTLLICCFGPLAED